MAISKKGIIIDSLEAWELHAGPKSRTHWVDGRSAKETARAWLVSDGSLPSEVLAALLAHPKFGDVISWNAEPEAKLRFDEFAGEPRNSDLIVHAKDGHGNYIMAVEAKADEPFGETVGEALAASLERFIGNPRSNGLTRIKLLASGLLKVSRVDDAPVHAIRYQLLTATAGALAEARRQNCRRAVLLVHEFATKLTADRNHRRNDSDLLSFLRRMGSDATGVDHTRLYGPFDTALFPGIALYIGKVARSLRRDA